MYVKLIVQGRMGIPVKKNFMTLRAAETEVG